MRTFLHSWHDFVGRHFGMVNAVVLVLFGVLAWQARKVEVDADWTSLFAENDPVLRNYLDVGARSSSQLDLYVKISGASQARMVELQEAVMDIDGVASVRQLSFPETIGSSAWIVVTMNSRLATSAGGRLRVLGDVEQYLNGERVKFAATGAEPILRDFGDSVKRGFIRTSVISLLLVGIVILASFGFSPPVVLGVGYQLFGLLLATTVFRWFFGSFNMLSATIPCVLVGLGVDFVIHATAAGTGDGDQDKTPVGHKVYSHVGAPMFWGAITTALAFLSLATTRLSGLKQVGFLGFLGILFMFATVMAFMPPVLTRFDNGKGNRSWGVWLPSSKHRRAVAGMTVLACGILATFSVRSHLETRMEKLYDPTMPALVLQEELVEELGVYPSMLFVKSTTPFSEAELASLQSASELFTLVRGPGHEATGINTRGSVSIVPILARSNPFDPANFADIEKAVRQAVGTRAASDIVLAGDAPLCHHLNHLLVTGMLRAFTIVYVLLGIVLACLFRSFRFVFGPLLILGMGVLATLGALALLGIGLSTYTLILFPLFVGIGVDDCLHVAYAILRKGSLRQARSVVRAIVLTTATTVAGYGALVFSANAGFAAMGRSAVIGLTLMLAGAMYVLPVILGKDAKTTDPVDTT